MVLLFDVLTEQVKNNIVFDSCFRNYFSAFSAMKSRLALKKSYSCFHTLVGGSPTIKSLKNNN